MRKELAVSGRKIDRKEFLGKKEVKMPDIMETAMSETASCPRRFGGLRGVKWRVDLGILPSSPAATIDDLRRVTADSRRR